MKGSRPGSNARRDFLDRTLQNLFRKLESARSAEELAQLPGLLQSLDPRAKLIGLLGLVVSAALSRSLMVILAVLIVALLMAVMSRLPLLSLSGAWIGAFIFSGLIGLPAIFITPGPIVGRLPVIGWPISATGLRSATLLVSRAETAVTLSLLLILSTPWIRVLKALRSLRVPVVVVVILGMTYRYVFVMLQTAHDMFEARRSRQVGRLSGRDRRRVVSASVGVLLSKTFYLSNEVHLAMQSRGYRGENYTLDEFQILTRDWVALTVFILLAVIALWLGQR